MSNSVVSVVGCSEPYKALDCFLAAAQDVMAEEFLISFMSQVSSDAKHIEVQYYLQVARLQFSVLLLFQSYGEISY